MGQDSMGWVVPEEGEAQADLSLFSGSSSCLLPRWQREPGTSGIR